MNNRIHDPALAGVLGELQDRLLTFYQETCDAVPFDADQRSKEIAFDRQHTGS